MIATLDFVGVFKLDLPISFIQYASDLVLEVPIDSQAFKSVNYAKACILVKGINCGNCKMIKQIY